MTTSASTTEGTWRKAEPSARLIGRVGWISAVLIGVLFVWFHGEFLWRTTLFAYTDKNWSHAFLVPVISAYFIFLNRERLSLAPVEAISQTARRRWAWLALTAIGCGLGASALGLWGGLGLFGIVLLAGALTLLGGGLLLLLAWAVVRPAVVSRVWSPLLGRVGLTTRPEDWLRVVGLGLLLAGLVLHVLALFPIQNHMARGYSMIVGLFGLCLFLLGPRAMAVLWVPIAYLVFAVKISDRLWQQIAQQLQDVAATGADILLQCFAAVLSFDVQSSGNQITLSFMRAGQWVSEPINIAEACSGLRMLMAFIALGTALAFLWDRRWWQRAIIIASTVPIAVFINIVRVTAIGLLYLVNRDLAQGDTHVFVGMLMLLPAAAMLLGVGWVLDRIIIEEPDAEGAEGRTRSRDAGSREADERAESLDAMLRRQTNQLARSGHSHADGGLNRATRLLRSMSPAWRGMLVGGGLTLLAGLAYWLLLVAFRPGLVGDWLPPVAAGGLLLITLLLVFTGTIGVPRLLPRGRGKAAGNRLMSIGVVVSALLVAGLGQQGLLAATKAVLFKHPLPLRKPLALIPESVGTWQSKGEDVMLSSAVEAELGTDKYLIRKYVDQSWPTEKPGRVARIQVAYYTGKISTVPHVPERCFVAGGLETKGTLDTQLTLHDEAYREKNGRVVAPSQLLADSERFEGPVGIPRRRIPATLFTFGRGQSQAGALASERGGTANVVYFFVANGTFMPSPDQVRIEGWDLRDKYAYYAKVEVSWPGLAEGKRARQRTEALLSQLMPEIMACLPDWRAVQRGEYPRPDKNVGEPPTAAGDARARRRPEHDAGSDEAGGSSVASVETSF